MNQDKPTNKQMKLIESIERTMGSRFDRSNATKESARKFIGENVDAYKKKMELEFTSSWALENGYV